VLLRLATLLRATDARVEPIDSVENPTRGRLHRCEVDKLDLDGVSVQRWRFGSPASELRRRLAGRLGPLPSLKRDHLDWVITGGESGPPARACDPDWVRDLRDRCTDAGVAFFHNQ